MESAKVLRDHDPIVDLARNAVDTRFEDLPADNVTFQKRRMLDDLDTCLAGANELKVNLERELVNNWGSILLHALLRLAGKTHTRIAPAPAV